MSVLFQNGSPVMLAGPTMSGKTQWILKLLLSEKQMFTQSYVSVLYCYGIYQKAYDTLRTKFAQIKPDITLEFYEGLPSKEMLKVRNDGQFHLLILDDLMELIVNDDKIECLFTKYCHHYNITSIYISQNVFAQGKCSRNIALNTHILILFSNKRDRSQIRTLARQLCPINSKLLIEAYNIATHKRYGYLIVDCSPATEDILRWRTRIFREENKAVKFFETDQD